MTKRILSFFICILLTIISNISVGAATYSQEEISLYIEKIISYKMNSFSISDKDELISELSENTDNTDTQWYIISLSKYGYDMSSLSDALQVSALKQYYDKAKATDFQRVAIALAACGIDCENVGGKNFIADSTYNNTAISKQGINAYAYALIALDAANVDESANTYIEEILKLQLPDGGFALTGNSSDVDVTAICLQALAPYRNNNDMVYESIDKAINCLSKRQNADGGYSSYGTKNCESTAQVISALVSMGIDPQKDSRFIKNDASTIDALLQYQNTDGGFAHIRGNKSNSMATVQALKALVDYNDFLNNKKSPITSSENNDKPIILSESKLTENTSNNLKKQSANENNVKNEEKQNVSIDTTECSVGTTQTVDKKLKSSNKTATSDEAYISDVSDVFIPIPTQDTSKIPQTYSDASIFIISVVGLLFLFVVLLVIRLIIAKKNSEKFSLNFIGRKGEDNEDKV